MTNIAKIALDCCGSNHPLVLKLRGSNVKRFHAEGEIGINQDVAQHTCRVMLILDYLWPNNAVLLRAALYHDLAEGLTGDIPGPLKRSLSTPMYVEYKNLEHEYEDYLEIPTVEGINFYRLKAADYLDLVLTATQLPRSRRAVQILTNGIRWVEEMAQKLPEEDAQLVMNLFKEIQKGRIYG